MQLWDSVSVIGYTYLEVTLCPKGTRAQGVMQHRSAPFKLPSMLAGRILADHLELQTIEASSTCSSSLRAACAGRSVAAHHALAVPLRGPPLDGLVISRSVQHLPGTPARGPHELCVCSRAGFVQAQPRHHACLPARNDMHLTTFTAPAACFLGQAGSFATPDRTAVSVDCTLRLQTRGRSLDVSSAHVAMRAGLAAWSTCARQATTQIGLAIGMQGMQQWMV